MQINIKDWNFKDTGKAFEMPDLAPNFGVKHTGIKDASYLQILTKDIISQVVRWQLAKKRSGNACSKTIGEISGTTRKPWAQKESGKARQGSLRSPQFRGGAVIFGPKPRSYEYSLNKKFKKLGLALTLTEKIKSDSFFVFDSFSADLKKTKDFIAWQTSHNLKSVLFVGDVAPSLQASFNNVIGIDSLPFMGLNVLSCLQHEKIILDEDAFKALIARYSHLNLEVQNA